MQSYEKYDEKDHSNIDINNYSTFPYSVVTVHVTELIFYLKVIPLVLSHIKKGAKHILEK